MPLAVEPVKTSPPAERGASAAKKHSPASRLGSFAAIAFALFVVLNVFVALNKHKEENVWVGAGEINNMAEHFCALPQRPNVVLLGSSL
ncbi:MAG: hypothetical protein ACRD3W_12545, partial [Terriglobales bacterium]